MFHLIKSLLAFPFVVFIYILALGIYISLYLQIVLAPPILMSIFSVVIFKDLPLDEALDYIYIIAGVGTLAGFVWAEMVRRKYSILGFHGYLLNHPEIDGKQQPSKGIVFRKGNLTNQ
ncbi:hypothetical protein [Thalassotalea sp. Y01]|uniref:hypothetical protein n=1 Tax=Thalassotalea sp. Y01 TaxID=2729613 RepID=UPI00145E85EB|nr:hypothetical protein [Thalassotalea sp. Y01]NMP17714.1 hypothetical protein [Thalassotalea sp. Y01]